MKNLKLWIILGIIAVVIIVMYSSIKGTYNSMVTLNEDVNTSWSQVVTDYQRRMDLIPNLVNTVKGYADFEQKTLVDVIQARANATAVNLKVDKMDATTMQKIEETQGALSSSLSRLLVTIEKYPDLKANQNFLDLQNQLEGTENRINVARQRYNQAVEVFNGSIRSFPESLTNNLLLHLERKEYFKATPQAQEVPKVKF